ncbi:hypothetical protein BDQ17DRAFT_1490130 [Cyathus striatus]|nr:hypothetical protein BDQ17DRAFT_1490130 [Cyathus striatus]
MVPHQANGKESAAILKAKRKAGTSSQTLCYAFLVGGSIVIGVFGMVLAVISYLCVAHKCWIADRHLVLTISQVASHIAPVTIPLLMGLTSYNLAERWLKASVTEGPDRPSPMQLGLLLSILNSANIPSLFFALLYFLGFGQTQQQKNFSAPSILRRSTAFLFISLLTTYLITGSDAWLHVTSKAVIIESILPYRNHNSSLISEPLGRAINQTQCDMAQVLAGPLSPYAPSCGQLSGGSGGDGVTKVPGLRTLSNSSSTHRIVFANDQTAIVVPATIPSNISYTAPTIGIKSSCKSITKICLSPNTSTGYNEYGPQSTLNINCSKKTKFNASPDFGLAALDDKGNAVDGFNVSSNPFHVGSVVTSIAYNDEDDLALPDNYIGNSGWFLHGNQGAWNIIYCDLSAVDVTYAYKSSTSEFTIMSSTPSSLQDTRAIITYEFQTYPRTDPVATAVDGVDLQTYEETYALELSRQTIAKGSNMYITQDTTDISREEQTLGTKIYLIPFTILLGMMMLYGTSYVHLASAHLSDPLTAVHSLYGPKDALCTWKDKTLEKFGTETDEDRLNIGEFNDDYGGRIFSVLKSEISDDISSFGK